MIPSLQLLAGACVSDVDNHAHGALHMAVEKDCPTILSVLLEHGADPDQMDEDGCNRKIFILLCTLPVHMYIGPLVHLGTGG